MSKRRRKRTGKRLWRRVLVLLFVPVIAVTILNLVFSTSWGTSFLERKVEARLGLPCSISRVSWSPWSGITLRDIRLSVADDLGQDEEIVTIQSVSIDPSWSSLIKGQKRFQRMEIQGVRGEISIELLKAILARGAAPTPQSVVPEAVAQTRPPMAIPSDDQTAPLNPLAPSDSPPVVEAQPTAPGTTEPVAGMAVPADDFEGSVVFHGVNLRVFSHELPVISAELIDLSGELPIWGGERPGNLSIGDFQLADQFQSGEIEIPLVFRDQTIQVNDFATKIFGLDLRLNAAVKFAPGLPFGIQFLLPPQQMDLSPIYRTSPPPFSIEAVQASGEVKGYVLMPRQMMGDGGAVFQGLVFRDQQDGSALTFDHGSALLQLTPAGLYSPDFRIIGEEDSILANGFLTPSGVAVAVVRIVSSPTRADSHEKRIARASDALSLQFKPLVTPDREFRDLHLEMRSGSLMIDLGTDEPWVPFLPAARAILGTQESQAPFFP